ncbi:ATP synthase beta subunit C-terminal domain-containing protein [Mesobacillus selenatarsenatis]|uniref:ATP synthase beta chain n=1 Tax=Mesobacillus selenatarsenatis (strain DSM 18680 / JCM 14380 / FERM P-15431 / SF-1) TaxID=1321606 RepID=A0A0A8X5X6_MESS1|nr:ATP synthase subunit B [Mesobacillus selenatarsenatis]GAM13546.1 ATP synthase beta chain [Mesobacillus selenatarsenatis SF-1]
MENLRLNVALLRKKVPNLTSAAKSVGLRPATVSNLSTGKIPVGRAEVRTIVALAELAGCSLDELILRGESVEMIKTGIKTLDLFAPIAKGGTVGLVARPGMGQLVVLAEMLYRLKSEGYVTILIKPKGNHPELDDILNDVDYVTNNIEETYKVMLKEGTEKDYVLTADRSCVISGEMFTLQETFDDKGISQVTTFLMDLKGEAVDEDLPYGPLDTLWQFDADLAARHKYPAINPIYSTSSILEGSYLDPVHHSIQQRAQKLLRRYRELRAIVNVHGIERLPAAESQIYQQGEKLEAYLTQPFFVAETYTGKKGEDVKLEETLNDVKRILENPSSISEANELNFIGNLN